MQPYTAKFAKVNLTPQAADIKIGMYQYRAEIEADKGWIREIGPEGKKTYPIVHVLGGKNVYYFLTPYEKVRLQTLPVAFEFYRRIEALTDTQFLHEMPVVRVFKSEDEQVRWAKRLRNPAYAPYYLQDPNPWLQSEAVDCSFEGFATRQSGFLDTSTFLDASRQEFTKQGSYQIGDSWEGIEATTTVFCQGFEAAQHPLFDWVPFKSAKGEILSLEIDAPEIPRDRIYNRGVW